ncbi:hypothetical protein [Streptococcus constellatus]|uniref:hypothetical protein n=1 Tax=Streptococcus constellatus TaxID=76860 RepID=UPI00189AB263|nr:hypothetical protein [Streptococcus constellatus]
MSDFENGYKFFESNSAGFVGANYTAEYVVDVEDEIAKLVKDLNSFEGFKTSSEKLKGDIAEFWHAGTFNIKAVVEGSKNRVWVDRSHDFASTDISTNFGDRYGLKFYSSGQASAKSQATSVFQRFSEYKAGGGNDSLENFLLKRGYNDLDKILNDPIYSGQIRIIPRDQLEEAVSWLQRMINTESARKPEQVYRYQETLELLSDRLKSSDGVESIPLSKKEAELLATLAKNGKIDAKKLGLTLTNLISFENIMKQSFKAGMTAAAISVMLKVAPEVYKAISFLIKNGELDEKQFQKIGFATLSGGSEGFVRGTISVALTTTCKAGFLGEMAKQIDPTIIGTITVLTVNVLKNAFLVSTGKKQKRDLTEELVRDMYISTCSLIGGGISQSFIEIPVFGYLIGSFLGSIFGSFTYNVGQKAVISFCVDSGFTLFGLVTQDYILSREILEEIGVETFDYETFEIDTFEFSGFDFDTFDTDSFKPDTLNITFLRRGVIGVSKIAYI